MSILVDEIHGHISCTKYLEVCMKCPLSIKFNMTYCILCTKHFKGFMTCPRGIKFNITYHIS